MSRRRKSSDTTPLDSIKLEGLLFMHELLERATRDIGSYDVTPCLPVDVFGVYVLLPVSL